MSSELFSSIEFEMTLFMLITILAYYLSYKISQSALVLQIMLGVIIGPSVLHLVSATDFIQSIAQFGAIILLFVIGLEFRLEEIAKPKYFLIALFGVLLPWGGGYLLAKAFGYAFGPALFIGAALTATSIALTANVLKEMGIIRSEIAKAIIGAAVIDDVLGLLVLAFSEQLLGGNVQVYLIIWIFIKALIFLIGGALLGLYFFNPIIHRIDKSPVAKKYPELVFITTIFLVFLYSVISEYFGLSAIIGAFLAGVSLEGVQLINSQSHRHGAEYLHMIFGSIFFVSLGVIVDFHGFSLGTFFFMIVLTLLAILTKCIGCGLCAFFQGYSFRDSLILGIGMSPRGEVAMIVALLGLNAGIIGQNVYVSLMLMSIITTVAVPPLLRQVLVRSSHKL